MSQKKIEAKLELKINFEQSNLIHSDYIVALTVTLWTKEGSFLLND
jgi:hypothetical protein